MNNITIIIPLHKFDKEIGKTLARAIDSVPSEYGVIISTTKEASEKIAKDKKFKNDRITVEWHTNNENGNEVESDFCTLVNHGVNSVTTPYFSILEFDDEYTDIWFKNVEEYLNYKPDVSVFLPLTDIFDYNNDKYYGYGNEAPWASSFSNEIGYIDIECLQQFFDFYLTGSIFNKEDWVTEGGLKPSIKLTFWYEFLLRVTSNGKQVFVIPKVGYRHYVGRSESLYETYKQTIDEKESSWWYELAKKECFFKTDRNKTYNGDS